MILSLIRRYVAFSRQHAGALTLLFAFVTAIALTQAVRLGLNTDMAELLPSDHPGVVALRRLSGRQRTSTYLVLLVSSPDAETTHRFRDRLKPALETLVPRVFESAQWEPSTQIYDHAAKWKWLYADKRELQQLSSLFDRVINKKNPMAVDLEGDPDAELKELRGRLQKQLPASPRTSFEIDMDDRHYLGVVLWRKGGGFGGVGDVESLAATHAVVDALKAESFGHDLRIDWTGAIAMSIDESNAVRDDLTVATGLCIFLVLLAIYLYFRRVAVLWVVGSPAIMGLILMLAIAHRSIGELNANTAFLLSIILGNGINAPIILLARYGEERRKGETVEEALFLALRGTILATGTAMLAASIAYGSLLGTSLRGLNQFGFIGGGGMALVWICSMLLAPPMIFLGERWKPGLLTPPPPSPLWRRPFQLLGGILARRPRGLLVAALLLTALAALPLRHWLRDPYEWNLDKLRTSDTTAQKRWSRMYDVIGGGELAGYIATDGIILVDKPEEAEPVAAALREKDAKLGAKNILRTVRTLDSLLPKDQPEKLEILAKLRRQIDHYLGQHLAQLTDAERKDALDWRPPDYLRALTVEDLPERILTAFTEVDGTRGRLVGIDVEFTHVSEKRGHELLQIAHAMEVDALGKHWVAAAASTVFAAMLEVILKDGPKVTLLAFAGVLLLLLFTFGWGGLPVMLSLAIGILWLGGIIASQDLRLNFLNFVALPITLGVAADYGANLWARLGAGGSVKEAIVETGSAVALCSATTVIGYSSLLLAHNGALRSFGWVADLGEVTCLWAALLVLPSLVRKRNTVAPPGEATGS
jgi:predicted RND superfamily exporter protein